MKGRLYIDDIDAYVRYGIWITEGGYNDLLSFPGLSDPEKNDWMEEDGIEVDLEAPTLKYKEVSITFVSSVPFRSAYDFIYKLSEPGYHVFRIPSLNREWRLRLLSHPTNEDWDTLTSLTLKFSEDLPVRPASIESAGCGVLIPKSMYEIDGVSLDKYGVVVEEGLDEILKSPTVKQNLTKTFSTSDGRLYDAEHLVFQSKDVTLKCVMIADSIERFWKCYDAFFHTLIQSGERTLFCDYTSEEYPCYYKKTSGWNIVSLSGQVVVEFSLTLVFTVFRVGETEFLLASQAGELITTEDGEYYIDLK